MSEPTSGDGSPEKSEKGGEVDPLETIDPAFSMSVFLDEDAGLKKDDDLDKNRQKVKRNRMIFIGVVVLLIVCLALVAGLTAQMGTETIHTFSVVTGHEFMLKARMLGHPDYDGELDPSGSVSVSFDDDDHFLISALMKGLEEQCEFCSMRVFSRNSCFEESGPPYWNHHVVRQNPWDRVHYTSNEGITHSAVATFTGHGPENMEGRIVMLDDSQGSHIACGVLERDGAPRKATTLYSYVSNLPGYTMTNIQGVVSVQFFKDDTFIFNLNFRGLPHLCERCAISIQEGMDCEPSMIGSHFFDHKEMERDPWATARGAYYSSGLDGTARRSFFLFNGHGFSDTTGHTVLVKAPDGTRIACGVLGTKRLELE